MSRPLILTVFLAFSVIGLQAANITWSPETGYQSDEAELSGLLPGEINKVQKWMNDGRAAEEKKRYRAALRRYKRVQKKFPKSQYAPESLFRTATIRMKQNKVDQAFDAYYLIAFVYPNYGSFNATIGEMYKIAVDRMKTHRTKIFGVIPGFLNLDRAVQYFERIVYIGPYSDYAPLSLMNIAHTWAKRKDETMTIYALDRLVTNYPRSFLTPDAYIELAKTHYSLTRGASYDQSNTDDAITYFEDFLIQFPSNSGVDLAEDGLAEAEDMKALSKVKIADFYFHKLNRLHAAKVLYNEAITIAPNSSTAEFARKKLAQIAKKEGPEASDDPPAEEGPKVEDLQKKVEKRAKRRVKSLF